MLPSYNKFWHPYDEWVMLESGRMINEGMIPYKDFFLLLYPPAQSYVIAGLLKVFANGIIAVRIYTILMQSVIAASVFYIIRKMAPFKYALIGFAACLCILPSYGRPVPIPTWPAIAFSLLSTLCLLIFIEREKLKFLALASFFAGLTLVFKHDIGVYTLLPGMAGLAMCSKYKPRWAVYGSFPCLFIGAAVIWLYRAGALSDAYRSLFVLPADYVANSALPFPPFCFDLTMIFHRGCLFIKRNQLYLPVITCAISACLLFKEIISNRINKRTISLTVLLLLGIFYLPQLAVRTDLPHFALAFPPSAILLGVIFTYKAKYGNIFYKTLHRIGLALVTLLLALSVYKAAESYFKETYGRAHIKKTITPVAFKQGTLYVPNDMKETLLALIDYVEKNTSPDEKIYVGPLNHSVHQFSPYQALYFVTERLPAVKYYEGSPGLYDREGVQEEMIGSLSRDKTRVLILRDHKTDTFQPGPLDRFIKSSYRLDKIIDTYRIYVRR